MDLWEAVDDDDVSKVRSLLEEGANPHHQLYWSRDWYSLTKKPPLHEACWNGYLEITRALVSGGADVEKRDGRLGMTSFHCACWGGHMETVVYLSQDVKCRIGKCMCVSRVVFIAKGLSPTRMFVVDCIATNLISNNYSICITVYSS